MAETPQESRVDLAGRVQRAFDEKRKPPRLTAQETRWVVDGLRASAEGESARVCPRCGADDPTDQRIIALEFDEVPCPDPFHEPAPPSEQPREGEARVDLAERLKQEAMQIRATSDRSSFDNGMAEGLERAASIAASALRASTEGAGEARARKGDRAMMPVVVTDDQDWPHSLIVQPVLGGSPYAVHPRDLAPDSPTEQGGTRACESCGETNGHKLDCPTLPGCGCRDDHVSWCPHYNQPAQGSEQEQVRVAKAVKAGEEWALIERLIGLAARCMMQEDVWTCTAAASEIRRLRPQGSEQGQVPARATRAPERGV